MSNSGGKGCRPRAKSMPPEKQLGISSFLPEPPSLPSSGKDSTSGANSISGTKRTLCASDSQGIPGSSSVGAKIVTDGDATARLPLEPRIGIDGTNTQVIAPATGIVSIDDDKEDGEGHVGGNNKKRQKRCTSWVWEYFSKKNVVIEENGKKYEQVWGHCNFARCKAKYRAECNHGTTGFSNHLKSAHKIVKGQLQLSLEKDGKDITTIKPFRSGGLVPC